MQKGYLLYPLDYTMLRNLLLGGQWNNIVIKIPDLSQTWVLALCTLHKCTNFSKLQLSQL